MKYFFRFLLGLATIFFGFMVYSSGVSARDTKYITNVILKDKGANTLENNKSPDFIENMMGLYKQIYNTEKIGSIHINESFPFSETETKHIFADIDFYQTISLQSDDANSFNSYIVINELSINETIPNSYLISGFYEFELNASQGHFSNYNLTDKDFPIFSMNNVIANSKINRLSKLTIKVDTVPIIEIDLGVDPKSDVLNTIIGQFKYKDFSNYPSEPQKMKDDVQKIYGSKSYDLSEPTSEQIGELKKLGYNYKVIKSDHKYDYLIWLYLGIYLILVAAITYFTFIKPSRKNRVIK